MSEKIFNLTLCKSGTTSLEYLANKYIKKKVYPYMSLFYNNEDLLKNFFVLKNFKIMDKYIIKYDFFSDIPINCLDYYKYLDKNYKNSKFILIIRDKHQWINSYENWLNRLNKINKGKVDTVAKYYWKTNFNNEIENYKFKNKNKILELYEEYNNKIIEYFKNKNNFLVLKLEDSENINKINKFLNVNIKLEKFPHKNNQ